MNHSQNLHAEKLSLIYLIGTYPGLTTTFIDREIRIMRQRGVNLQIMAIHPPAAGATLSEEQQELREGVIYLLPAATWTLIVAHLYFLLLRPHIYAGTLAYLATRPHPSAKARFKSVLHFGMGVYAAYLLRQREFYEIHAHFVDRTATLALVASRLLGKPYSLSIHAGADVFVEPVLLDEKISEARHAVTCTEYNRTHIESLLGRDLSHRITHIRHGLNLACYCPEESPAHQRPLILSVGQLAERKGFAQLVEVCAKLKARGYDFECHIVGQGPQRRRLEQMIGELDLQETVRLCGALSHNEVIAEYKNATIFAMLCVVTKNGDVDGIPNVIAEAMAMQLPVVSTAVSAIPELVVDGVNGLVVPPADIDAAANAIARLLDDPTLAAALTEQGRETILNTFDVEENVQQFAATLWPQWFEKSPSKAAAKPPMRSPMRTPMQERYT